MIFDLPKEQSSIIKVIGVGGGGSNAVNHMYRLGIKGVDFIVCNTDHQALDVSPVPTKIQLGATLTGGMGAGSIPEVGRNAAIENLDQIKDILSRNTKMVFITAGMGGGTGTGAAPVIAATAREMGILTVGIITIPFAFEGKKRKAQAEEGLEEIKKNVDTLLVVCNDKLREIHGNLKLAEAFAHADNVLSNAAKSIAEIISITLHINVDFEDVRTVMQNSGVAIMGSASATGENRALKAVELALNSPLLNDNNIKGARYVLLSITSGTDDITMDELGEITDFIQEESGHTAELIHGYGTDESLGDKVNVTIIATGFNAKTPFTGMETSKKPERIIRNLVDDVKPVITAVTTEEVPAAVAEQKEEDIDTSNEPYLITHSEEQQQTIVFDLTSSVPVPVTNEQVMDEPVLKSDPVFENMTESSIEKIQSDEQRKKAQDRIAKMRELSHKFKSPNGLAEMEKEPAYKRRNVSLEPTPHSSESQVSRFTLSEGDDKKVEIKPGNSFLHDNVD
jgi:cell division protein FtsZ